MKTLIGLGVLMLTVSVAGSWVKEMENPNLYQGDIVLDPDEWENRNATHEFASIKGGRWPGAKVPYVITSSIGQRGKDAIHAAIESYHKNTCIRFHPRTNEAEYISFYMGQGCNSPVGYRRGRVNHISLGRGCWWTGTTIHEIGHSMGFHHEQNRPDRDDFVVINWNNIQKGLAFAFYKQPKERIDSLGTPYDLESTMHYGTYAFSKNRRPTITVKDKSKQHLIRDNRGFSKIDIIQLNLMYCNGKTMPPPVCDNKNPRCEEWAKRGECEKNPFWMKENCCKACKEHSQGGGGKKTDPPVTQPPVTQPPGGCDNKNPRCEEWAKRGECLNSHGRWMSQNCCKACKDFACPGACVNKDKRCDVWAGRGDCNNGHGPWMRCNCCISCKGK